MGIFGFLFGLGCLVLIAWAITTLSSLVFDLFGHKRRQQNRPLGQPSPKPTQFRERNSPQPTIAAPPTLTTPHRQVVALRQPVLSRVRLPSNRHQRYIQLADSVLKRLRDRSTVVQLPEALGILRKMNPYAFEDLLLTCCHKQGWEIKRNFSYSNDDGIDRGVLIASNLHQ